MFKSMPFWAVVIGSFGIMWFVITISMQLPPYLDQVHKVNIKTVNFLFGLVFIIKKISVSLFCRLDFY